MLLADGLWHDHEEEVGWVCGSRFLHGFVVLDDCLLVVGVESCLEVIDVGLVSQMDDVSELNVDVQVVLLREVVEALL